MEGICHGKGKKSDGKVSGNMKDEGKLKRGEKIVILLFLLFLFGGLLWKGGVKAYPDTNSYLTMSSNREPGYALLLNTVVRTAGEKGFWVIGILQNGLAVFSIHLIICYVGNVMKSRWICALTALCLIFPHIMTPLFSSSGLILTNSLLSEGITVPLYNIYFWFMMKAVWEKERKKKNLGGALAAAFILSLFRGQMLVALIAWVIIAVFLECGFGRPFWVRWKKLLLLAGIFAVTLGLRTICVSGYNLAVNGKFTGTTYGSVTILSNVIYVTEEADKEEIEDEDLRGLFEEIYEIAEAGEMCYRYAPEGMIEEAVFYSKMHDEIKDLAIYPFLLSYTEHVEGIEDYMERLVRVDALASAMTRELLPGCMKEWFLHYIRNILVGLIRTVAFLHPLLILPAMVGYGLLILMGIYCYRRNRESKAAGVLFLTMLLTIGNAAAVALTIMCISRYMVYNMPFIYLSAFLLLREINENIRKDRKQRKSEVTIQIV